MIGEKIYVYKDDGRTEISFEGILIAFVPREAGTVRAPVKVMAILYVEESDTFIEVSMHLLGTKKPSVKKNSGQASKFQKDSSDDEE